MDPAHISIPSFPLNSPAAAFESIPFPEVFVLQIPNGRVIGKDGLVITDDDLVLIDTAQSFFPAEESAILKKWRLPKLEKREERIAVIAAPGGNCNYFHWMFDVLPRIEILKKSGIEYDKIYLTALSRPFHKQTLALFCGLDPDKIIWAKNKTHLQASTLIVPSLPSHSGVVPLWTAELLREKIQPNLETYQDKKIYISRKNALLRRVVNEEELIEKLKSLGFEIVCLENLRVEDQAKLFASSKVIVAPHGASLTNLIFCQKGTKLIELFPSNYIVPIFWIMSQQLGLDHTCIKQICISEEGQDMQVDIPNLMQKINLHMAQDHKAKK